MEIRIDFFIGQGMTDVLVLIDVSEWINNETSETLFIHSESSSEFSL